MAGVSGVIRALSKQPTNYAKFLRISVSAYSSARNPSTLPECRNTQMLVPTRSISIHQALQQSSNSGNNNFFGVFYGIPFPKVSLLSIFRAGCRLTRGITNKFCLVKFFSTSVGLVVAVGSFVGFFTFVTPLLIHWLTKKYVMKIEYDPKTDMYSATTLSFFLREKKIQFSIGDVHVPDVPGMFTTFHANGRPLFVEPDTFKDLEHYGRIMGYDKPIDFRLGPDNEDKD
ncbi:unnamed protein product, partial [Meganyctiphanes norvegica]